MQHKSMSLLWLNVMKKRDDFNRRDEEDRFLPSQQPQCAVLTLLTPRSIPVEYTKKRYINLIHSDNIELEEI